MLGAPEARTDVRERVDIARIDDNGRAVVAQCLFVLAEDRQANAEIVVCDRVFRMIYQDSAVNRDGRLVGLGLVQHHRCS